MKYNSHPVKINATSIYGGKLKSCRFKNFICLCKYKSYRYGSGSASASGSTSGSG